MVRDALFLVGIDQFPGRYPRDWRCPAHNDIRSYVRLSEPAGHDSRQDKPPLESRSQVDRLESAAKIAARYPGRITASGQVGMIDCVAPEHYAESLAGFQLLPGHQALGFVI